MERVAEKLVARQVKNLKSNDDQQAGGRMQL
jgi:hypothetical protein